MATIDKPANRWLLSSGIQTVATSSPRFCSSVISHFSEGLFIGNSVYMHNFQNVNFQILKYEVKEPELPPLFLNAYWKLEAQNTDLRIDYRLNMDGTVNCSLLNVVFTTKVEGAVVNVIADPKAEW